MTDNPYETPQGELIDPAESSEAAGFYVVSKKKLILLSAFTVGFYQVYWYYRNWKLQKLATGEKIWPVPRAIFSIFFVHSLFRAVNDKKEGGAVPREGWNHGRTATTIVILVIVSRLLDRLASQSIGSPVTDLLALLILVPTIACFASAQTRINEACGDPEGESNNKLTVANYVWIVIGLLFWALVAIGIFVTPMEEY